MTDIKRAIDFYSKNPYRVEVKVLTNTTPGKAKYRTTEEFFKSEEKARKRYEAIVKLHSPEWMISLCRFRGMFWDVLETNRSQHHLYRFDEFAIESGVFNLDKIRERVTA